MKDRFSSFLLTTVLLLVSNALLLAQQPSSSSSQIPLSATTGKEAVCEGGAEIIPSGQQSFARKRYVAAKPKVGSKPTKARLRK